MKLFGREFFIRKPPEPVNITKEEKRQGVAFGINLKTITRSSKDIDDWLTALKQAESITNPHRNRLYDLYFHMILDDDYITGLNKRKSAITNLNLQYFIGDKLDEGVDQFIENPAFRDFKKEVMDTIFWGYSLFEFYYKGQVNPYTNRRNTEGMFDYNLIPRKHVSPKRGEILKSDFDVTGYSYRVPEFEKNLLEFGKADDFGLLLVISIPIIYKRNSLGDWAQYSELAGNNFRNVKIEGTDRTKREAVTKALNDAGSGGLIALPEGTDIDFIRNSSQSSNELFENFNKTMSDSILRLILGQTGTTSDSGEGSYARAKVSYQVEQNIFSNDKTYFLDFMNYHFIHKLPYWGFSDKGEFSFEEIDTKTRREKVEEDKILNDIKPLPQKYLEDKYDIKYEKGTD